MCVCVCVCVCMCVCVCVCVLCFIAYQPLWVNQCKIPPCRGNENWKENRLNIIRVLMRSTLRYQLYNRTNRNVCY